MNNTLIDNSCGELSMSKIVKDCLKDTDIRQIKIATGYWDLPAMLVLFDELSEFLKRDDVSIQLLIGQDPVVRTYQQFQPIIKDARFPQDFIKKDITELELKPEYQQVVDLLLDCCSTEKPKLEIRIYRQDENADAQFLHSKCYIFIGQNKAYGIIGSSNFTKKGLEDNAELNYLETNPLIVASANSMQNVKSHKEWFDEKWVLSQAWNKVFLEEILKKSPIGIETEKIRNETTPYDVYIRFMQDLWGDILDSNNTAMLETFLPPEIDKIQYQFDAVNQGYGIMKRHNGFILADVVGLGKTIVGILIVKRFLEDIDVENRERKVLIVTPPAIKKSWQDTIALFDAKDGLQNHITFVTTGSIGNLVDAESDEIEDIDDENADFEINKTEKYGLILIDESHKFRNSDTQMYRKMDDLIGSIFPNPYVVLLSATPQNNSPKDLKNQIFLFQREHQNTTLDKIEGRKLDTFFVEKERQFTELKTQRNNEKLIAISREIREKALDDILVRRTRADIKKFYADDAQNLKFPEISPQSPCMLKYELDSELAQLFADTMDIIAPFDKENNQFYFDKKGLYYYRYRAIEFFEKEEHKKLYEKRNLTTESISKRLARIMQILLVKRLESSFSAFKTSLHNLQRYTQNMLTMLDDNTVFICPDIDINAELHKEITETGPVKIRSKEESYKVIRQKIADKKGNNREFHTADFLPQYKEGLLEDKRLIDNLCERWDKTTYDPKLRKFLKALDNILFDKSTNNPHGYDLQKLVIFTEAIDTVKELEREIKGDGEHKVLAVTAKNRDELQAVIKANFDANATEQKNDFDIIIATEVLAEGVNLHRSNVIVNYDTPWNSTRLMQRIGRVNRIGSKEDYIHVFNFMPTAQGDAQIGLVGRAHQKLQAFHAMFGEDSKIFTDAEVLPAYENNPENFRNMIDGEESPHEQYIAELRKLKNEKLSLYQRIEKLPLPLQCAKRAETEKTFCVVQGQKGKKLYIAADNTGAKDIPTMEVLENLRCTPATKVEKLPDNLTEIHEKAINEFVQFFQKMLTAKDSNKKERTKALGNIKTLTNKTSLQESRQLLQIADRLVRKGNLSLARKINLLFAQMHENQLFNISQDDFNSLINSEFSTLKNRLSENEKGKPEIVLSMTNKSNQI